MHLENINSTYDGGSYATHKSKYSIVRVKLRAILLHHRLDNIQCCVLYDGL